MEVSDSALTIGSSARKLQRCFCPCRKLKSPGMLQEEHSTSLLRISWSATYYQAAMEDEEKVKTNFTCLFEHYKYEGMSFGLYNTLALFSV